MVWWPLFFLVIPPVFLWVYELPGILQRDTKGWKKAAWVLQTGLKAPGSPVPCSGQDVFRSGERRNRRHEGHRRHS